MIKKKLFYPFTGRYSSCLMVNYELATFFVIILDRMNQGV